MGKTPQKRCTSQTRIVIFHIWPGIILSVRKNMLDFSSMVGKDKIQKNMEVLLTTIGRYGLKPENWNLMNIL